MRNKILLLLFFMFSFVGFGQEKITWEDLAKVEYADKYFPEYDSEFLFPTFSEHVKQFDGRIVELKGYFLTVDPNEEVFVLSKNPMASCFFCGVGGPETAVELHFEKAPSLKMDAIVIVSGRLKLNSEDVKHFNYILNDCKVIKKL